MLYLKIDTSKIDKTKLYKGKATTYLDCILFENREPDKYGNTHVIIQSVSKEDRAKGIKGAIIGNAKPPQTAGPPPPARVPASKIVNDVVKNDDIPF